MSGRGADEKESKSIRTTIHSLLVKLLFLIYLDHTKLTHEQQVKDLRPKLEDRRINEKKTETKLPAFFQHV